MWTTPGPDNVCSVDLADKCNAQVECDLLCVHQYIIFHLIDRCTRWHAGRVVPNKEEETLTTALAELWVQIHGPMKELFIDGETGMVASDLSNTYLRRQSIQLRVRAKDQHARFIERRGVLLRDQRHITESQLEVEGVENTFPSSAC